jgi:hypothetical protein
MFIHEMHRSYPTVLLLYDPKGITMVSDAYLAVDLDRGRGLEKKEENTTVFRSERDSTLKP